MIGRCLTTHRQHDGNQKGIMKNVLTANTINDDSKSNLDDRL